MKKYLVLILIIAIFLISSCSAELKESQLSYESTVFAEETEKGLQIKGDNKYNKGETVYLVINNVKGFQKGNDNLNWFDVEVEISKDENVLISQENLLGDKGHINLEEGIANSPFGTFSSNELLESGIYNFKLTVKDLIGKGEVSATKEFELI